MSTATTPFTYSDLLTQLQALTPEQLSQQVRHINECTQGTVTGLWVLEEDHIDPSGEGLEPASNYRPKPGEAFDEETHLSEEAIELENTWSGGSVFIELA
jgi:hypothetical protein